MSEHHESSEAVLGLSIRLLGPTQVQVAGETASFRNRRSLVLLALLAVDDRPHRRDRIMAMLWPEADEQRARGSMRSTLHRLREGLGPARTALSVDQHTVQLSLDDGVWVDVHALARVEAALDVTNLPSLTAAASQLGRLDRGAFAEGLGLDGAPELSGWIAAEQDRWSSRIDRLNGRVLEGLAALAEWDIAANVASSWAGRHPLSDRAHLGLIEARTNLGDTAGAHAAWLRCRELWWEELGMTPSPAVAEAVRDMLGPTTPVPASRSDRPTTTAVRHEPLPMVGNEDALASLRDSVRSLAAGEPIVVRLEAAAGIGKSRLLDRFVAEIELADDRVEVLSGRSHEAGARHSYQVFIDLLRPRLERVNAPDDLLDDVWLAELARLLPEIRERYPDLDPPMVSDGELARSRLFEAVYRVIAALANNGPVVLALDDVHRCDPGSLELLGRMVARAGLDGVALLVILAFRPDEVDAHLGSLLDQLSNGVPPALVALDPLDADEIHRLLTADEEAAVATVANALYAHTGGVPLLIDGMTIALIEAGEITRDPVTGRCVVDGLAARLAAGALLPVPTGLEQVVARRVGGLDPAERRLLNAASVLGSPSRLIDLCAVGAVELEEGLIGLERLLDRRLLVVDDGTELTYRPAHDLLREATKTVAGAERCRLLHRRAFETLSRAGARAADLAYHAEAATLWDEALAARISALDEALGALGWQDATRHGTAAVALLDRATAHEDDEAALYRDLSVAMQLAGRPVECDRHLAEAQERAALAGSYRLELELRLQRLDFRINPHPLWDPEGADAEMQELRELAAARGDDIGIARVDVREATRIHMTGERADQGSTIANRCLENLPQSYGDERLEVLSALATFCAWDGDDDGVVRAAENARTGWRNRNQPRRVARTHFVVNLHRLLCGRLDEAAIDIAAGRELARRSGDRWHGVTLGELEARVAFERGDIDSAVAALSEALDACRSPDLHGLVFGCAPGLALLELERGRLGAAVGALAEVPVLYAAMASQGGSIRDKWGAGADDLASVAATLPRTAAGPVYAAGISVRLATGDLAGAVRLDGASQHIRLDDVAILRLDELAFARADLAVTAIDQSGTDQSGTDQGRAVAEALAAGRAMALRRDQHLLVATFSEAEARVRRALGDDAAADELTTEAVERASACGAVTRVERLRRVW